MQPLLIKYYDLFHKLFSSYGINSITMDDIAATIHVSKKTIYKEYQCKDELVREFLISDSHKFKQQLSILNEESTDAINETIQLYGIILTKIFSINASVLYDLRKYYPALLHDLVLLYREIIINSYVSVLKKGKTDNLFHNEIRVDSIANMSSFLFEAYVFRHISVVSEDITFDWNELLDYHFKSICTLSGLQKWETIKNQTIKPLCL